MAKKGSRKARAAAAQKEAAHSAEFSRELTEKEKEDLVRQSDLDLAMDLFGDNEGTPSSTGRKY